MLGDGEAGHANFGRLVSQNRTQVPSQGEFGDMWVVVKIMLPFLDTHYGTAPKI